MTNLHPITDDERTPAQIADQTRHLCDLCGVPITALSCYGWYEGDGAVHACWACRVEIESYEREAK